MQFKFHKNGFTLIELLVVISIISLLSSIVLSNLNTARMKGRDARRKADLTQLRYATEIRYSTTGDYPGTAGWFTNPNHGGLDAALTPTYINKISDDPINSGGNIYIYLRKDWNNGGATACLTAVGADNYGFYAKLENPTALDLLSISASDAYDTCVKNTWGMNFKLGN